MAEDTPPLDPVVVGAIKKEDGGIGVRELIAELSATYERDNVIRAIQRVLDRGLARLGDDAKIVVVPEHVPIAA